MLDAKKPRKHRTLSAPDGTIRMARSLRKSMSLPEVLLWQQLKARPGGYIFRKQHPIGPYVLDFACIKARLDIEVDGEAHSRGDRPVRDEARTDWLTRNGFATLRIPATDILKNMESAVIRIVVECQNRAAPNANRSQPA